MNEKYTKQILENAVKDSKTVADVMRKLGVKYTGGGHSHISSRLKFYNIDTSHFLGRAWTKGKILSNRRFKPNEILISGKIRRENAGRLRRALIESGIKYECRFCKINEWNGKKITLQVDHIDGNWSDCRIENLRFLCPNCHSQTDTFCSKK